MFHKGERELKPLWVGGQGVIMKKLWEGGGLIRGWCQCSKNPKAPKHCPGCGNAFYGCASRPR